MQTVVCKCCNGTGRVDLSPRYSETLALVRRHTARKLNGFELSEYAGCSHEAMCNRLRALEKHGLIKGTKYGREICWELAPTK